MLDCFVWLRLFYFALNYNYFSEIYFLADLQKINNQIEKLFILR